MPAALKPLNESDRLRVLREYNILDTPSDDVLNALTQATSLLLGTPIAMISLIDVDRQWFMSKSGVDGTEGPRSHALCSHVIESDGRLAIPDARQDDRVKDSDYVTGDFGLRAYMGAPLRTEDGYVIGSLCVLDNNRPRHFSPMEQRILDELASMVMSHLDVRRARGRLDAILDEFGSTEANRETLEKIAQKLQPLLDYGVPVWREHEDEGRSLAPSIEHIKKMYEDEFKSSGNVLTVGDLNVGKELDMGRVEYVLGRLIHNANRFTSQGTIHVSTRQDDAHSYVIVSDDGVGIERDCLAHLTRFFDDASRDLAGFSLSACEHLCHSMGAHLRIASDVGKGTSVAIVF